MRQQLTRRPHTATIERLVETGSTNGLGEPLKERTEIASGVSCAVSDESVEFVRQETGERVQRPLTARFAPEAPVQSGDLLTFDVREGTFEVQTIETVRDLRRGRPLARRVEVERYD
jgi:hypothetical protein